MELPSARSREFCRSPGGDPAWRRTAPEKDDAGIYAGKILMGSRPDWMDGPFDDLVGAGEDRFRHWQTEHRLGGRQM